MEIFAMRTFLKALLESKWEIQPEMMSIDWCRENATVSYYCYYHSYFIIAIVCMTTGAHSLGKNHARDARWVEDGTKFNNQYYKDMLSNQSNWKRSPNR